VKHPNKQEREQQGTGSHLQFYAKHHSVFKLDDVVPDDYGG